jgi:chemotaxis protein MotB
MRKKKHAEHVNHERWLVSYADFITLLFAFFVVMFAVSQVDSKKLGRFTEAFSKALGNEMFPEKGIGLLPAADSLPIAPPPDDTLLPPELEGIKIVLSAMVAEKTNALLGMQILKRRNELVLRLSDNIIFESGEDTLKPPALVMLRALAPELVGHNVDFRVEGHTDTRPINTPRFRSNWDLSTARATTVIAVLAGEGIAPHRLAAAGYGEFHPIASNATEEGRKQNRHVDIVVTMAVPDDPAEETVQR